MPNVDDYVHLSLILQTELSQSSQTVNELRAALLEKENEVNSLSARVQEETTSLQAALQSKEDQLTQTTDKLLQVSCTGRGSR